MAITFTWSVNDMHKVTATGAVFRVDWSCSGIDEDTSVSHSRSGSYLHKVSVTTDDVTSNVQATPDHTAEGFVAYNSLKEADVLVWVKADGEGDNHWVDSCQEMTELLKTVNINTTSTGDENTIVEPPKNKEKEKKEKVKKEKVKKEKKKKVKKPTSRQMAKELKFRLVLKI